MLIQEIGRVGHRPRPRLAAGVPGPGRLLPSSTQAVDDQQPQPQPLCFREVGNILENVRVYL